MFRRFIGGGLATGAASATYFYNYDEDFRRSAVLFKELGPIISHYRFVEAKLRYFPKNEVDEEEEWKTLHTRYSDRVTETLRDLRGFYIKVAQVMYFLYLSI
jgi:hypothetical protein